MAKKKRQGQRPLESTRPTAAPAFDGPQPRRFPDWRWRTFPVFFAFVIGLLLASFINGRPNNDVAAAVQIISLLGLGYGLAHLFVVNVIIAGRVKRRREAIDRGETPAEEFEEELVYPEEQPPAARR